MNKIHSVYLVNPKSPCQPIRLRELRIVVCENTTWAEDSRKRYLLGSTAFYTEAAAKRAKFMALQKVVRSDYLKWKKPEFFIKSCKQFTNYLNTGTFEHE